jgi:hypothetical protein
MNAQRKASSLKFALPAPVRRGLSAETPDEKDDRQKLLEEYEKLLRQLDRKAPDNTPTPPGPDNKENSSGKR